MLKLKLPILWPPDVKNWLIRKDWDAGRDWGQEEKGAAEDEVAGGHHWLGGPEFKQTPRDSEGQGSLACCSPRGHKELGTAERLKTKLFPCKVKLAPIPQSSSPCWADAVSFPVLSELPMQLLFWGSLGSLLSLHRHACTSHSCFLAPLTEPVRLWCAWSWGVLWNLKTWSLEDLTHSSA